MSKETWKSAGHIAWMSTVGAAEGATIGALAGAPWFGIAALPGGIAGGLIGGVTALSAELAGHAASTNVLVEDTTVTQRMDVPNQESVVLTASESAQNVPLIRLPDTILKLRMQAFSRAIGHWKSNVTETVATADTRVADLKFAPVR